MNIKDILKVNKKDILKVNKKDILNVNKKKIRTEIGIEIFAQACNHNRCIQ